MATDAESCPWCGEPDLAGAASCGRCRGTLLVDVVTAAPVLVPRERFHAARLLTELGAGAFADLKEALSRGGVVVAGLPRQRAREAVAALAAAGVEASFRPHAAPAHRGRPWPLLAGLALVPAIALALLVARERRPPAVAPPAPPAATAAGEQSPGPLAPLTTQQIGQRALAAVASVSCGNQVGAGFFVEPELLITSAHVTCESDDTVQVQMRDGRRLLGTTVLRDATIDLARVLVVGAAAPPLPVGEAAALVPGDRVVFIGSPRGMSFTLHEGTVSYVGRAVYGVGYLQINGDVNPGNSGGPVVDAAGRAVGVVSLKVENADGIGLALPIEYAVPPSGEAGRRWAEVLRDVAAQDDQALSRFRVGLDEPRLLGLEVDEGRPVPLVLQRWSGAPHPTSEVYELRRGGQRVCGGRVSLRTWMPLERSLQGQSAQLLQWLRRSVASDELRVGAGELDEGCAVSELYAGGDLVLVRDGADHGSARVDLDAGDAARLAAAQRRDADRRRQLEERQRLQDAGRERYWRQRFAGARDGVARVDREVERAQAEMRRLDALVVRRGGYGLRGNAAIEYQRLQDYVANADRHRQEAEDALRELEREASNEDVPLEWRR